MRRLLVLLCACAACGDDGAPDARLTPPPIDAGDAADASVDADLPDAGPAPIQVAETDGVMDLPFRINAFGAGTDQIGAIDIGFNTGTVEIAGRTIDAVAYVRPPPFPGWN